MDIVGRGEGTPALRIYIMGCVDTASSAPRAQVTGDHKGRPYETVWRGGRLCPPVLFYPRETPGQYIVYHKKFFL